MDYTIRPLRPEEYPLLHDFLYEAIFIPEGAQPPPRSIILSPELQVYVAGFEPVRETYEEYIMLINL